MAEGPNAAAPPSPIERQPAIVSAICPDDLGLKAGFWTRNEGDPVTFRPLVGWVTVMNFVQAGIGPFVPLVLNDLAFPSFLTELNFPTFVGVFAKALTPEEAHEKLKSWMPLTAEKSNQVTLSTEAGLTLTVPPTGPVKEQPTKKGGTQSPRRGRRSTY
jgi:hypothetical protein